MPTKQYEIALSTFERTRAAFPALVMNLDLHPEHLDVAMDIPAQPGLLFDVHLNLQNIDELHLCAAAFWFEWFPCTYPEKVEKYFEAVSGLLSGQFRILQYWRGKRVVKARLQCPSHGEWKTIARYSKEFSLPWSHKTIEVVQNQSAAEPVSDKAGRQA
jgi:hypothetical protein